MPQGVKASVAFFGASLVTKGISYIVTPIYTRLLSPTEYGQVSVFTTWLEIFGIIAMFCLSYGVFNNGMLDYPDRRDEYSFSMLILSNLITVVFFAILLCLYPLIREFLKIDLPLLLIMGIVFLLQPAYNFWAGRQRYELKYKYTALFSILSAFLTPTVAIICILLNPGERLYARIFGAEITLCLFYIAFYLYLLIRARGRVNTAYWKAALLFNLPLIPHYLSTYLLGSSDKLMISNMVSDAATAYYSVAHSVAAVVIIVWTAINSSLIPYTYEKCKEKDYPAISKVTLPLLTMFAVMCTVAIMFAPEVVAIMATESYREAIYAIPPIVGGVFFQVQYYVYANIVYYHKKPKYVMIASMTAMVLNLILNYIFIREFGYIAAGYTTLVCYFAQASIDYFAMKRVTKDRVYNMRYIGALSLCVVAIALLSNLLYDYVLIRYAIILCVLIALFICRKRIIGLLKAMKKR
jgi:O-antigen/teichoic acid export membrane protein